MDEYDVITRNKARLLEKGYKQVEGTNYWDNYALVVRLEVIRLLLHSLVAYTLSFTKWTLNMLFLMAI